MKKIILSLAILFSSFLYSQPTYATAGVVVLGGGGPEGDIGVTTDWSYSLYKRLIDNGDVTGDGKIKVVVLSLEQPDTNFIVDYLKSMGATTSENLVVKSRKDAQNKKLVDTLIDADVLFIRGGNQAKAYAFWKNTRLHQLISALAERGGAIGGTSSGSMSLSSYTMTGGHDYDSKEILADAKSSLLDDIKRPGHTGIHNDFLKMVPGTIVDTHCGERGRIGRILGVKAKATEEYKDKNILVICLEERTGVAISKNRAQVYGTNAVHFLQETPETKVIREKGKPLVYTEIRDDMLTDGWHYDLEKKSPDLSKLPAGAQAFESSASSEWSVSYNAFTDEYLKTGETKRGLAQTLSFKRLSDQPRSSVVIMDISSELRMLSDDELISMKKRKVLPLQKEISSLVIDCRFCTHRSLSPYLSNQDFGSKTLYTPGLVNMRLNAIGGSAVYNLKTHQTEFKPVPTAIKICQKGKPLMVTDVVDGKIEDVGMRNCR